jgi:hypothetical protein
MAPSETLQPKDFIPDILFSPEGATLSEDDQKHLKDAQVYLRGTNDLLCRACGWTAYNELTSSYLPRVRICHTRDNSGLWNMGVDWMIWDRKTGTNVGNDYMTFRFLREQGTKNIPLVKEMHQYGNAEDQFNFTVLSRAKGKMLGSVWKELSADEKNDYAQQMIVILREVRQFTSAAPKRVDGSPLWDNILGNCPVPTKCKNIEDPKEAWFDNMAEELRCGLSEVLETQDEDIIEVNLQQLKDNFPEGGPYVLTHADLSFNNIIVNNGKIEAIIDWELAGYYPWWVERWASYQRSTHEDSDELFDIVWKELDPDHNREVFRNKVSKRVTEVQEAYRHCPINHTEDHDLWLRPRWCECKPWGGRVHRADWDAEMDHSIGYRRKSLTRYPENYVCPISKFYETV